MRDESEHSASIARTVAEGSEKPLHDLRIQLQPGNHVDVISDVLPVTALVTAKILQDLSDLCLYVFA